MTWDTCSASLVVSKKKVIAFIGDLPTQMKLAIAVGRSLKIGQIDRSRILRRSNNSKETSRKKMYGNATRKELLAMIKKHPNNGRVKIKGCSALNRAEVLTLYLRIVEKHEEAVQRAKERKADRARWERLQRKYNLSNPYDDVEFDPGFDMVSSALNAMWNAMHIVKDHLVTLIRIKTLTEEIARLKEAIKTDPDVTQDDIVFLEKNLHGMIDRINPDQIKSVISIASWNVRSFLEKVAPRFGYREP